MDKLCIILLISSLLQYQVQAVPYNLTKTRYVSSDVLKDPDEPIHTVQERRLHNSNNRARSPDTDGKIIFPDDVSIRPTPTPPRSVPVCKNSTFCEQAQEYPKDYLKIALRMNPDLKYLASVDEPVERTEIDQRIDATTDDSLCLARENVVFPKSAENKQRQWRYIVNDDDFLQGVRIETCMSEGSGCRIIEGFAEGYRTYCKQKYIYRQLASITTDGSLSPDFFKFPSSCCCHIHFVGSPMERIGFIGRSREKGMSKAKSSN
ncbi:protein spaetzle-like isoform X2 [Chelonus insularis]|uniref:protein spaetzle-like isoform X2 n=1 Tax=Chelonus insularis TaxID=460826 RepID=UPI00158F2469|nr:protein spaetzle-like isoform X2 [Chelonus insularis]